MICEMPGCPLAIDRQLHIHFTNNDHQFINIPLSIVYAFGQELCTPDNYVN